ncbi:MAG: serine/threonine-protein kinase [Gemmataceae bacterium]
MSDTLGDPLPNLTPSTKPSSPVGDDEAVNLFDASAEPTDNSPTIISKAAPQGPIHAEDQFSGGLRGRRLAHYELIEPIGVGGMAAVLRARDTQLDRLVALKILPPEMAADVENVRRFHQEARSAARLDHENIARVFFCGEDQRLHFIAFEFVEGDNLRALLEKRGRLPVGEALHYILQVAAGLAHAACRGVVHRDIKPSNIIITPNGRAKLVDMGLARSLDTRQDMALTQSGVTLGTFDYISPEQALEPRDADVRSDIYSLGCTFYHVLTGQAPVPEGTAAKKLHHHQHVKPTDPRQFVPDLPDEAAFILDRMMAKQPKDRYQTPEHLVHHLYLAARKLGVAEVPEGVLTVEAALPSPPAGRPFVLAAVASIAVVALIFLVDLASTPKPQSAPFPLVDSEQAAPSEPRASTSGPAEPIPDPRGSENPSETPIKQMEPAPPIFSLEKPTMAALADFLRTYETAPAIVLELDDLDLSNRGDNTPDLVVRNPSVTIKSRKPNQRPTIRDQYRDRLPGTFQASLTIESKTCTIENLRFVLNQTGASVPMAILWLKNCREVNIRRCEFLQAEPCSEREKEKDSRMASLLFESDDPASLILTESCFLGFGSLAIRSGEGREELVFSGAASGGQDAVARRGPVRIEAANCLFGPHAAVFRLEGGSLGENGLLRLKHCSAIASNPSAIFDLADGADAQIEVGFSLFSHLGDSSMMGMSEGKGACLMRRASTLGEVSYKGQDNRYHQFDNYFVVADAPMEMGPPALDGTSIQNSEKLDLFPWNDSQPLDLLKDQVQPSAIKAAFAVKPLLVELRVPSRAKASGQLIGAEKALTFSYLDNLPRLNEKPAGPPSRVRVVQSRQPPDESKRLYKTLEHALLDAQPGDIIDIQLDGEVKLDARPLNGKNLADLTIRAHSGFHPILTLNEEEQDNVSALFSVFNGKLQLEGLEIRLRPRGEDDGCAMVAFRGGGECVLKRCLVTLERSNRRASLAMLPRKRMSNSAAAAKTPHLQVENCLIRGQGDLLWLPDGLSAEVTIDNSLIALSGSLLNVDAEDKETAAPAREKAEPPTAPLTLHLHKTTTYLGDNLIRLHAVKDIKGLANTRCEPTECLFLPADDRPLVRLEGPEGEESGLREKLVWERAGKNAYGNFSALLEFQFVDSMRMPSALNQEKWKKDISGERDSEYNVKLPNPPPSDAAFTQLLPAAFRPDANLKEYGADLAILRSLPALKGKADEPEPDDDFPIPDD